MSNIYDMPDYSPEQKIKAFDLMWNKLGRSNGKFYDYVAREINTASNEATYERVPRFMFEIVAEGNNMRTFADVLHYLATSK